MRLIHRFVKTTRFKEAIDDLDAWLEVDDLKLLLDLNPELGKPIVGGEGLRKVRLARPGMGKRGGARVIYYQIVDKKVIALLFAYPKSKSENLNVDQLIAVIKYRDEVVRFLEEERDEKNN